MCVCVCLCVCVCVCVCVYVMWLVVLVAMGCEIRNGSLNILEAGLFSFSVHVSFTCTVPLLLSPSLNQLRVS